MASERRWQTGLYLADPSGYTFNGMPSNALYRWLFEFLVKVVGWTDVDSDDAKWDNVAASGVDGATDAVLTDRFISASASFTQADVGAYLTITGIASPNEERNGIYLISAFVNSTTVVLNTNLGVHSDGLPVGLSGLSWRKWLLNSTTAYVPAYNAVSVVAGRGKTGAGLKDAVGPIGTASFSISGSTVTLADTGATFQASDVGKDVVIENATTPGNNGTYTITAWLSATQIQYTNASGATEAFGGSTTWKIRYTFHLHIQVATGSASDPTPMGGFTISPWPTWNAGTNSWSDSRHTAQYIQSFPQLLDRLQTTQVWAVADMDCVTIYARTVETYYGWSQSHILYQFGELDTFYPAQDPRPVMMMVSRSQADYKDAIGTSATWSASPSGNIRMMSWDDVTSLTAYLMFPHCPYSSDYNWTAGHRRHKSQFSHKLYRLPLIVESRTSGHMELRGTLRHIQRTNTNQPFSLMPIGATHSLIHIVGGLLLPWHGGKQWYEFGGRSNGSS